MLERVPVEIFFERVFSGGPISPVQRPPRVLELNKLTEIKIIYISHNNEWKIIPTT